MSDATPGRRSTASPTRRTPGAVRIVLRMPNWLGDCIMALPALRFLRESLPDAEIVAACRGSLLELMAAQPEIDAVAKTPDKGFGNLLSALAKGRGSAGGAAVRDSDLGVLFTNSLSTAVWMWRMGVKNRLGYNLDGRRMFLTHPVVRDQRIAALHFVDYYLELAKRAVSAVKSWQNRSIYVRDVDVDKDFLVPRLVVGAAGESAAAKIVAEAGFHGEYAVIAPASAYGPVKDWPPEHYRQLARTLRYRYGIPVFVTGGAKQAAVCEGIADNDEQIVNLAGKTDLGSFLGLLASATLFVGGDSGGAHAAAAFGVPTLVIFGITNPTRTRPSGDSVVMLGAGERRDVKLSTASARIKAEEALRGINVEQALEAIELMLGQ